MHVINSGAARTYLFIHIYHVMRYYVTRIKSEIMKAQKARKTLGKMNWAIQLSSFLSFCFVFFLQ